MKNLLLALLLIISSSPMVAQSFVISNVTLFDGDKLIENTSVLVENGLIKEVSKEIQVSTTLIDGSGKFLMPAMTNSHVHAWSAGSLKDAMKAGVVNLLDMHGMERFQPLLANLRDSTSFARYYFSGSAATVPNGHGTQYGFPVATLTDASEAEKFVDDRLKAGAHYLKIIVEPSKETLTHETVKALIEAAHSRETNAVVHISRVDDATRVLANGADGLVHIWWDKPIDEKRLQVLSEARYFFVIPTLLTTKLIMERMNPEGKQNERLSMEEISAEVRKLYEAGVPILAGTDPPNADINYGTDLYKELKLLSDAGVPNLDVLKAATSLPAKYFRLGYTGSIKKDYSADMILLTQNPIDDIENIKYIDRIWKAGREVPVGDK